MSNCNNEIVENICPYCGEHLMMNKKTFANHVRWCKLNPKYEENRNKTILKIKEKTTHKRLKYICKCKVCGNEYEITTTENQYNKGNYKKTCSKECAAKLSFINCDKILKNNKISNTIKNNNIQSGNYKEKYIKVCPYCNKKFTTYKQNQICCSVKCASYYKYLNNTQISDKYLINVYKRLCSFTFALNSYPQEFDFSLIEKYGWYKAKNHGNNLNGVSRDHIYSQNKGFENLIDPYIISHPANCQLLQHTDNASKYDKCEISLEDLIKKIIQWNNKYGEYPNNIDYSLFNKLNIEFKTI